MGIIKAVESLPGGLSTWSLTVAVIFIDVCWLLLGGWAVSWSSLTAIAAVTGLQALLTLKRYRSDILIRTTLQAAVLLILFTAVASTLSYLVVSTNAPLVDASLAALDRALGFNWLALETWLRHHQTTKAVLHLAYFSGLGQIVFVVIFLGFTARHDALNEFLHLFIVASLVSIALSGVVPAAGAWNYYDLTAGYDLPSLTHFEMLRNGQLREINLDRMQGLISIPSMHAATAVLLINAMRQARLLLPVFIVLNGAMIVATPVEGSHYLVDVLAGVALAAGLIGVYSFQHLRSSASAIPVQTAEFGVIQQ